MNTPSIPSAEGHAPFEIPGLDEPSKTWYKIFGSLDDPGRPLITLHGGPGLNSAYLEILGDLVSPGKTNAVIVYDQIGNGNSTHFRERMGDTSFFSIQLFIDELENLIKKLKIEEYDLLGHSWGGMLAASYAIRQPSGLKHLVLMSSASSKEVSSAEQRRLKASLPKPVLEVLERNEKAGTTNSLEYQEAMGVFYRTHLCRVYPMPEPVVQGFKVIATDPTVTMTM